MGLRRVIGLAVTVAAIVFAIVQLAAGAGGHVYSVRLTIKADQAAHRLSGAVLSKAPSEYCDTSKLRIRKVEGGTDPLVAKVRPDKTGKWSLKSPASLRGTRVYAEVSRYRLPNRPVECLSARSPKVAAP